MKGRLSRRERKRLERQLPPSDPAGNPVRGGVAAWTYRSGPLPDPKELAVYEEVVPGSAQMIMEKFAEQSDHRRRLEGIVVEGNDRRANRGQWMAFTIALSAIIGGVYLIANDKPTAGLTAIVASLTSLVIAFITGKVFQERERREKRGTNP